MKSKKLFNPESLKKEQISVDS